MTEFKIDTETVRSTGTTAAKPHAHRWRLWHLFALTAFIAMEFAFLCYIPGLGCLVLGAISAALFDRLMRRDKYSGVARILVALVVGLGATFQAGEFLYSFLNWPELSQLVKRREERNNLRNNLNRILLAIDVHNDQSGSPPMPTTFQNGVPWRSWRTDVLSYLELGSLADSYDPAEAWDGPNNRRLWTTLSQSTDGYVYQTDANGRTPFLAVVDEQGRWPAPVLEYFAANAAKSNYRGPPGSEIIIVIVLPQPAAIWTEPYDLAPGSLAGTELTVDGQPVEDLLVGFADGRAEYLPLSEIKRLAPQLFQATPQGASP